MRPSVSTEIVGGKLRFTIDVQTFTVEVPEDPGHPYEERLEWYKAMLDKALEKLQAETDRLEKLLFEGHEHCPNCEHPVQPRKLKLPGTNGEAGSVEVNPDGSPCYQLFAAQAGPYDMGTPVLVLGPREIEKLTGGEQ